MLEKIGIVGRNRIGIFAKLISVFAVIYLVMAMTTLYAQTDKEGVNERRLKINEYRQKMMAGWYMLK